LAELEHEGALNWIQNFENEVNETNILLPISLARNGMYWYEMSASTLADFVVNINFDRSLYVARLNERSFVDQRLIRLAYQEDYQDSNSNLIHALLNSVSAMFFIEALGFCRGFPGFRFERNKI